MDLLPRIARLQAIHFAAKAAMGYRGAAMVAQKRHMRLALDLCEYAHEESRFLELYCEEILAEKRQQIMRRGGDHLDHVLNECVLATLYRKILTSLFTQKG